MKIFDIKNMCSDMWNIVTHMFVVYNNCDEDDDVNNATIKLPYAIIKFKKKIIIAQQKWKINMMNFV